MPKLTRNILLGLGIFITLCVLGLRIEGQLAGPSGSLGMFSGLLGYDGSRNYALVYIEQHKTPLLFLIRADSGSVVLQSVAPAHTIVNLLSRSDFPDNAKKMLSAEDLASVDAMAFITSDAAGRAVDAFAGVYIDREQLRASSTPTLISSLLVSQSSIDTFNSSISIKAGNLFTRGPALLTTIKNIFSQKQAGVYFKNESPFGKSCIGACGMEFYTLLSSPLSL